MKIGDLIMIGDDLFIITAKKWRDTKNDWYYAVQDHFGGVPIWLVEDLVLQCWRDRIWWTKNVLDNKD